MQHRWLLAVVVTVCVVLSLNPCMAQETVAESAAAAGDQPAGEAADAVMVAPAPEGQAPVAPAEEPERELTTGEAFLLKLRQGGITMVFLFLASVAGLGYAIERLVNLRAGRLVPTELANRANTLWQMHRWDELLTLPERSKSALARVIAEIARHRHSSMADVSMLAGDVASRELRRHLQKAYPLAVVATVSPLLGLLGTVIGMIGAFDKVAAAGSLGDASLLGGDISKALITTGTGLTIAVPALVLYHYFKSRTNYYGLALEEALSDLISEWYGAEEDRAEPGREGDDARQA